MSRRILFIGGTGTISAASVRRAVDLGHDVTVVNRGSSRRPLPAEVSTITADIRTPGALADALQGAEFDAVADFLSFTPEHVSTSLDAVEGRTGQYVFISSASAYQKPPVRLPVTESTPLRNPFWQYSRDKIACEDLLVRAYRERGLPATIVRPSHTYDERLWPNMGGWTDIARLRDGKPAVIHGDGTTPWTLTHSDDFAVGFVGLLGNPLAVGDSFHITGDHAPTWNQIYSWLAEAAGVDAPDFVHVTSEAIARLHPEHGDSLLGDKSHAAVYDNAKIRALVPEFGTTVLFDEGARRIVRHYDENPGERRFDPELDAVFDRLVARERADIA